MGWRERDWARFTDAERRQLYGSGGGYSTRRSSSGWLKPGAGLAVAVSAAIFALGHFPQNHPLLPALRLHLPPSAHSAPQSRPLHIPHTAQFRSTLTLWGSVGDDSSGPVVVEGHWNARPWKTMAATQIVSDHSWHTRIVLDRTGMLNLRVLLPGGSRLVGSVRVIRGRSPRGHVPKMTGGPSTRITVSMISRPQRSRIPA